MKSKRNCRAHPRSGFTHEEDCLLIDLVRKYGNDSWSTIASKMEKRNARQCKDRYTSYLSPNINNSPYTKEEDELLKQKYNEIGPKWVKISKFFLNRTDISVKCRWAVLNRKELKKREKTMLTSETDGIIQNNSDNITNNSDSTFEESFTLNDNSSKSSKRDNINSSSKTKIAKRRYTKKKNMNDSEPQTYRSHMTIRKRDKKHLYNYDDDFEEIDDDEVRIFNHKTYQNDDYQVLQSSDKTEYAPSPHSSEENRALTYSLQSNMSNTFQSFGSIDQKKVTSPQKVDNTPSASQSHSSFFTNNNSMELNSMASFNSKTSCDIFSGSNEEKIVDKPQAKEEDFVDEFYWDFYWDMPIVKNESPINLFWSNQPAFD